MNLPDYRAPERTFQLLVQVAGRAGRGEDPGDVVIQTYEPDHYAMCRGGHGRITGPFINQEVERRNSGLYPPFTLMARLSVAKPRKWKQARAAAEQYQKSDSIRIFPTAP